jgi:hypothetical protein
VVTRSPLRTLVTWSPTGDALIPWKARVEDQTWSLRVNDFPEERLYSLLIDGKEVETLDAWPPRWHRLKSPERGAARSSRGGVSPSEKNGARQVASRGRKSGS